MQAKLKHFNGKKVQKSLIHTIRLKNYVRVIQTNPPPTYLYHMKSPLFERIPGWIKNKYAITIVAFVVWVTFFDRNDLFSQYTYRQQLEKLEVDKSYYISEIEKNKKDMEELMSDPEHLEKYAREHYLMKRDNEDIFLIVEDTLAAHD